MSSSLSTSPSPQSPTNPKRARPTRVLHYTRPPLYARQQEFIDRPERYVIVEASSKAGKTVALLLWIFEQAMRGRAGRNYWWVAPVHPQAKIAYRRLRQRLRFISEKTHFPLARFNQTDQTITLANGAVIWFKSAEKPDNLYGEDVYAAVMDEATRCREESWHAVRSTLVATGGPIRIIGNVKGRRNWAYQLARKAEAGEPDMAHFRLTAYDAAEGLAELKALGRIPQSAKVITVEDIEDAKRQLPENVFNELFLAIPSDDGGNPFGLEHIRRQTRTMSVGAAAAVGIDLAKSVDWTVVLGLDWDGHTVQFERWQGSWESTETRILAITKAPALVDSTGVGDPVEEKLRRRTAGRIQGYKFTPISKQQLMEGLAVAIQSSAVDFPVEVARELEPFEYEYSRTGVKYGAPPGLHDDCVMALALAVEQRTRATGHSWLEYLKQANAERAEAAAPKEIATVTTAGRLTRDRERK